MWFLDWGKSMVSMGTVVLEQGRNRLAARRMRANATVVVEELDHVGGLAALDSDWERLRYELSLQGRSKGPFLSARWFAIFATSLLAKPGRRLRLLVARQAGRVCGLVPLFAEYRRVAGIPARVLCSLTDDHSQRFDPLILEDETAHAIIEHLAFNRDWDALELRETLDEVAAGDRAQGTTGTERLVRAARARTLPTGRWWGSRSPYLPLPDGMSLVETQLSTKFRANLRRRARNLARDRGPLSLELVSAPEEVTAALDDGFRLEAAGWKGREGTAILCDPDLEGRYRNLARTFAETGALALYFLRAGQERVAFHFGLIEDDIYYLLKPGFDPSLAAYGPGHLLVHMVVRDLIDRGVRELDFLGESMPWKEEWTSHVRGKAWQYIFAPHPFGRFLASWRLGLFPPLRSAAYHVRQLLAGHLSTQRLEQHDAKLRPLVHAFQSLYRRSPC
jgi:CelD/BcsL family acetyltransferase involved in cellulose biosynthesis